MALSDAEQAAYARELKERDVRQKGLDAVVKAATQAVASRISKRKPTLFSHFFYGAMGIDPRHLTMWYLFESDAELTDAKSSGLTDSIADLTRDELAARGFPEGAIPLICVAFTTQEDIQRVAGGDYRLYFQ
jgi:hypothetical protein